MARKKVETDPIPELLEEAQAAQERGREILDTLNVLNEQYVPLLHELQELEATIQRTRRNIEHVNQNITAANEGRDDPQPLHEVPVTINAMERTHRNLPVTEIAALPQLVADGPFWEGASPQYVRFKT